MSSLESVHELDCSLQENVSFPIDKSWPLEEFFQLKSASNATPHKFVIAKEVTSKIVYDDLTFLNGFESLLGDYQEAHELYPIILIMNIVESTSSGICLKEANLITKWKDG